MRTLRHPNIIQLLATCSAPVCVLMEYCDRGNLMTVLQDSSVSHSGTDYIIFGLSPAAPRRHDFIFVFKLIFSR